MIDLSDVREKLKRKNKILFSRSSPCLQELLICLSKQSHKAIVLWAFECAVYPIAHLSKRYRDDRPVAALETCKKWAGGEIKMPAAKKAILQVHSMAKELSDPVDIALCHAVGQACSAVHVETHAIGIAVYELTALVLKHGIENCDHIIEEKIQDYILTLKECEIKSLSPLYSWANFLLDDKKPNKEMLILNKKL